MRKLLSIGLLILGIIVVSFVTTSADTTPRQTPTEIGPMPTIAERIETLANGMVAAEDPAFYIILLQDPPLARYQGTIDGLAATSPAALGTPRLDLTTPASIAYLAHIDLQHANLLSTMETLFARDVELAANYKYAMNGVAAWLLPNEAAVVAEFPNVSLVEREKFLETQTDAGPAWIEATSIWDGSASPAPANLATKGEGIVAGIIDTGVNSVNNPSFADTTDDGYVFENPRGEWFGLCVGGVYPCNNKLIGVHDFTGTTFEDDNNHGSHTASTTVGNEITITVDGNDGSYTQDFNVSGVAPRANLITYKVCIEVGCINVSTGLGIDQATADGVDVINYSIGGSSGDPWSDAGAEAFLGAFDANILVAVAAGNDGPGPQTIGSPSNAPWVASVAATKHDRSLTNSVTGMQDSNGNPLPDIVGTSYNSGYGPAQVVYAGDYLNLGDAALCEQPFAPLTFSGEIVICDRGIIARVEKCRNVELGGAGGCILANDAANGDSTSADPHDVPSVHISYDNGLLLKQYLAENPNLMATITPTNVGSDKQSADVMAGFSSRGPDASVFGVLKPDIGAPGVDILAAYSVINGNHGLLSGTSMASPHYAGALTLMRALHPDWTVAEVRSALMLTAFYDPYTGGKETHVFFDDDGVTPADPHDVGAGRVNLARAALAGFVMNETSANFTAANPANGGDPTTLNLASMSDGACAGDCTFTREIKSTADAAVTWTLGGVSADGIDIAISPSTFTLQPGETQAIKFSLEVSALPDGRWAFGAVNFTPSDTDIPPARIPIAVLPNNLTGALTKIEVDTRRAAGSELQTGALVSTLPITNLHTLPYDLAPGSIEVRTLEQDPTPLDAYDVAVGTFFITVTVPADTKLLFTEVIDTSSADLDMYVGIDKNGNGPEESEEVCSSATETALESCSLLVPEEGTYWIMVQNWLGGLSSVTLQTAVLSGVDADVDDLDVTGPTSAAPSTPLDLRVAWDKDEMAAGETWFGLVLLGSDTEIAAGDVGAVMLQVNRLEDDVVKSADNTEVNVNDTVNYTVEVQPSARNVDEMYEIVDTIPANATLDAGSVSASAGTTQVNGNEITWTFTQATGGADVPTLTYAVSADVDNSFIINDADSIVTNDPNSRVETSSVTVTVGDAIPTAVQLTDQAQQLSASTLLLIILVGGSLLTTTLYLQRRRNVK